MNLAEIGIFKDRVISKLIRDKNIVDLLLGERAAEDDIETLLLGADGTGADGCVYKYEYVPDVQETTKTFLCVEAVPNKTAGSTTTELLLYVFAYCNKAIMQTYRRDGASGTRPDILISDVDKILSGNTEFGIGKLEWVDGDIYKPTNNYYGRMSVYTVHAFRRDRSLND